MPLILLDDAGAGAQTYQTVTVNGNEAAAARFAMTVELLQQKICCIWPELFAAYDLTSTAAYGLAFAATNGLTYIVATAAYGVNPAAAHCQTSTAAYGPILYCYIWLLPESLSRLQINQFL